MQNRKEKNIEILIAYFFTLKKSSASSPIWNFLISYFKLHVHGKTNLALIGKILPILFQHELYTLQIYLKNILKCKNIKN